VADYDHEEEQQIEALEAWWKENGTSVMWGIAVGFAMLFGWRSWQNYQFQQSQVASTLYDVVLTVSHEKNTAQLDDNAQKILTDYTNTGYAALTSLLKASKQVESGQPQPAQASLQWVIDNAHLPELKAIAQLRMAKLLINNNDFDGANKYLSNVTNTAFQSAVEELRGDLLVAQQKPADAVAAYEKALKDEALAQQHRQWLQLKRDNLGMQTQVVAATAHLIPDAATLPPPQTITPDLAQPTTVNP
jgi:predicted negative regulator of RcsB-dependent stress response